MQPEALHAAAQKVPIPADTRKVYVEAAVREMPLQRVVPSE